MPVANILAVLFLWVSSVATLVDPNVSTIEVLLGLGFFGLGVLNLAFAIGSITDMVADKTAEQVEFLLRVNRGEMLKEQYAHEKVLRQKSRKEKKIFLLLALLATACIYLVRLPTQRQQKQLT